MKLVEITPKRLRCLVGACPAIFESSDGTYVLIGKRVDSDLRAQLNGRVGDDEVVIEIPKELLATLTQHRNED